MNSFGMPGSGRVGRGSENDVLCYCRNQEWHCNVRDPRINFFPTGCIDGSTLTTRVKRPLAGIHHSGGTRLQRTALTAPFMRLVEQTYIHEEYTEIREQ